jgi:hypothetical protein
MWSYEERQLYAGSRRNVQEIKHLDTLDRYLLDNEAEQKDNRLNSIAKT